MQLPKIKAAQEKLETQEPSEILTSKGLKAF